MIALAVAVAKLAPGLLDPGHFNKMLNQLPNETISKIVANLLHVDLKLNSIPLENAFLLALVNLARRRDIELYLTRCQVFIDTTPVSAFKLRIVTFAAT